MEFQFHYFERFCALVISRSPLLKSIRLNTRHFPKALQGAKVALGRLVEEFKATNPDITFTVNYQSDIQLHDREIRFVADSETRIVSIDRGFDIYFPDGRGEYNEANLGQPQCVGVKIHYYTQIRGGWDWDCAFLGAD